MSSAKQKTRERILNATWRLLEEHRGQIVHMQTIAQAAGITRQNLYLHFKSRTELITATMNYVDDVKGLEDRLKSLEVAKSGLELLETCVDVWGNYIPEIYGMAKAMLMTRDTDEATAKAWDGSMSCLRDICEDTIEALDKEEILSSEWSQEEATDLFFTMLSIQTWEQLVIECGWSQTQYINWIKKILLGTFVDMPNAV